MENSTVMSQLTVAFCVASNNLCSFIISVVMSIFTMRSSSVKKLSSPADSSTAIKGNGCSVVRPVNKGKERFE